MSDRPGMLLLFAWNDFAGFVSRMKMEETLRLATYDREEVFRYLDRTNIMSSYERVEVYSVELIPMPFPYNRVTLLMRPTMAMLNDMWFRVMEEMGGGGVVFLGPRTDYSPYRIVEESDSPDVTGAYRSKAYKLFVQDEEEDEDY